MPSCLPAVISQDLLLFGAFSRPAGGKASCARAYGGLPRTGGLRCLPGRSSSAATASASASKRCARASSVIHALRFRGSRDPRSGKRLPSATAASCFVAPARPAQNSLARRGHTLRQSIPDLAASALNDATSFLTRPQRREPGDAVSSRTRRSGWYRETRPAAASTQSGFRMGAGGFLQPQSTSVVPPSRTTK